MYHKERCAAGNLVALPLRLGERLCKCWIDWPLWVASGGSVMVARTAGIGAEETCTLRRRLRFSARVRFNDSAAVGHAGAAVWERLKRGDDEVRPGEAMTNVEDAVYIADGPQLTRAQRRAAQRQARKAEKRAGRAA